jgi:hypothetical protein
MKGVVFVVIVALAAVVAVEFAGSGSKASASSSKTYALRRGDFVRIPALAWTCFVGTQPHSNAKAFYCTSDDKPVADLWIGSRRIFVGTGHAPVRFKNGYLFVYRRSQAEQRSVGPACGNVT